ncbi:MAG: GerMN domain-containing protein [Candidatus Gastranaerophilales bacterium]|nr:GerMN domain-containing protein [Candidatus Gastranaerophilales bacterium]
MNTFIKTFIVCLIVALGFFIYKFVISESYSPDLSVSNDNPVFTNTTNRFDKVEKSPIEKLPIEEEFEKNQLPEVDNKYEYTCFFYSSTGKLIPVKREFSVKQSLENTIDMLLKGPTITESRQGIYSEIPKNVDLISVNQGQDSIIVNLTSAFGQGGGSQSIENRLKQLSKTIKNRYKDKKIYLYIDNKEVEYLGGEGVYVKQPLD